MPILTWFYSIYCKCISHEDVLGTVPLVANVTLRHCLTCPTTGKKKGSPWSSFSIFLLPSVAEKLLQICPGKAAHNILLNTFVPAVYPHPSWIFLPIHNAVHSHYSLVIQAWPWSHRTADTLKPCVWIKFIIGWWNVLFASTRTGKLECLLLWFFGSILAFISCNIHWEDNYQNYGRGALLYKTWQSVFYHVNPFNGPALADLWERTQLRRRQTNTVADHSSFWRIRFKERKWEQKVGHPALLAPDESPNQSCIISSHRYRCDPLASAEHSWWFFSIISNQNKMKQSRRNKSYTW